MCFNPVPFCTLEEWLAQGWKQVLSWANEKTDPPQNLFFVEQFCYCANSLA